MRIPLFAANWKMNQSIAEIAPYIEALSSRLHKIPGHLGKDYQVVIAPPATHLQTMKAVIGGKGFEVGAQNCGHTASGAFTGEISPKTLQEMQCTWVVLGHSERRHIYLETDAMIQGRLRGAFENQLKPIFCVGETLAARKAGQTESIVEGQLLGLKELKNHLTNQDWVIAYEPVWAIGTGENAAPQQAQEVHAFIRKWLKSHLSGPVAEKTRILYGGSVKPDNCADLKRQPDIDGFLVGGASLQADSFGAIVENSLKIRS